MCDTNNASGNKRRFSVSLSEQPLPAAFRSLEFHGHCPTPATPTVHRGISPLRAAQGNSFIWRKLHSLLGIIPIGAFLLEHLLSNFEALKGPIAYGAQVKFLNASRWSASSNESSSSAHLYHASMRSTSGCAASRTSFTTPGWQLALHLPALHRLIAFAYIAQHVYRQRFTGIALPENPYASFAKVQHELANPWMLAVYIIAMIAICWHFSYGSGSSPPSGASLPVKRPASASAMSASRRHRPRRHGWPASGLRRRQIPQRPRKPHPAISLSISAPSSGRSSI